MPDECRSARDVQSTDWTAELRRIPQQGEPLLAAGANPTENIYTVTTSSGLPSATGLRLEALPHNSLPAMGPGRNINGNYVLAEVALKTKAGGVVESVVFKEANATVEQRGGFRAALTIDGKLKGSDQDGWGWAIIPHTGKPQTLYIEFANPVSLKGLPQLQIELHHHYGPGGSHTLGCFRLALTGDEFPTTRELRKFGRFENWHRAEAR